MTIEAEYNNFIHEIEKTRNDLLQIIAQNTREDELYKGFTILYSELIQNPTLLFIGINPGAGYFNLTGIKTRDIDLLPSDGFEYLDYGGTLADETIEVFKSINKEALLEYSMKTNIHYITTSSQKELHELLGILDAKYGINMYRKSIEWTKRIIKMINPKIIVCEGAYVVKTLAEYFEKDNDIKWENGIASFTLDDEKAVVGYRRCFSRILKKSELSKKLERLILCNNS